MRDVRLLQYSQDHTINYMTYRHYVFREMFFYLWLFYTEVANGSKELFIKLSKEEIESISEIIKNNSNALAIIDTIAFINRLSELLKYPVSDAKELITQIGDNKFSWRGITLKLSDLEPLMPAKLFPIQNQDDFIFKAESASLEMYKPEIFQEVSLPQELLKLAKSFTP